MRRLVPVLAVIATLVSVSVPSAKAVTDAEFLTQFGSFGTAAGQLSFIGGIATDPVTGHVFVSSLGHTKRIDEFTPWGNFVKAFGWDVAPGAVDEEQELRVRAAAGNFKLTFGASTTSDVEYGAPGSESEGPGSVEAALNALPSISSGGGSVSVKIASGNAAGTTPYVYVISFHGSQAATDVGQIAASSSTPPLSGGSPSTSLEVRTRADGTPGGSGLEVCTAASGCKAGTPGSGSGQLGGVVPDLSVDKSGDVYVRDSDNNRVEKFDSAGRFLWMIGGEVDKTSGENLCTAASGDQCGVGVSGTGPGEFSPQSLGLATGPGGTLFVGDKNRIQEFESNGAFQGQVAIAGETVVGLSFDANSGDYYVRLNPSSPSGAKDIHRFDPAGNAVGSLPVLNAGSTATDTVGNVYGIEHTTQNHLERVLEFSPNGISVGQLDVEDPSSHESAVVVLQGLATNGVGDLYVGHSTEGIAYIRLYGPPPVNFEGPPKVAPSITAQYATSVDTRSATVRAQINPHFWPDARYYVEYGSGKCSEGGCDKKPLPPGAALTFKAIDGPVTSGGVLLEGLQPATTYHYRFVVQSGGGGPVRGVGGKVGEDGEEATFTTFSLPGSPNSACANNAFRTGPSANLPDCRAYEMVSPVEKNNGDILVPVDITGFTNGLYKSAIDGEKFTYSSYRAFGDAKAAPYVNQYIASRGAGGWSSESLGAPHDSTIYGVGPALENEYKAFSPDLCSTWLVTQADPALAPGAVEGFPNAYRRSNCPRSYEAITTATPVSNTPISYLPELQGASADGTKSIFRVNDKLTPDAAGGGAYQLYEASAGGLQPVCILPSGTPSGGNCSAGTAGRFEDRTASVAHAISEDGTKVYWSTSSTSYGPGKLYLRLNGDSTVKVSEAPGAASTLRAQFWRAAADGSKALFTITEGVKAGNLYRYDLGEEASSLIAGKVLGVAGASEDLSYVYFVSKEALGGKGSADQPNLYLWHEGESTFVATLSSTDVQIESSEGGEGAALPSDVAPGPIFHVAQATAGGVHLAFISNRSLTGYDNLDATTGQPDSEVYLYDAGSGEPACVSCNPSGARPAGRSVQAAGNSGFLATAASIPAAENQLTYPRIVSEDGSHVFFDSYDALLPADTNGKEDVYEWERPGAGDCAEESPSFSPVNGGCIALISSGESPEDSEFLDASPDGRDVFFATNASLLPQDPGLIDVYDARSDGGFPQPPGSPGACEGEACQGPQSAPNDPTPASSSFEGVGNVVKTTTRKKHKKKAHRKSHKRAQPPGGRANSKRGAGR